jgi:hypothetical protein
MPVRSAPTKRPTGRAARPTRRAPGGTTQARGRTFAHETGHPGLTAVNQKSAGPLGEAFRGKYPMNDTVTLGWIGLALKDPMIRPHVNFNNVGTGPELCVCGYYLSHGYHTTGANANLFFQSEKFLIGDRSRVKLLKKFVVDIAIDSPWGGLIYLNIDGAFFHTRSELEIFKDAVRNRGQAAQGRPISLPDTVTYRAPDLVAFLTREGIGR